jgi:exodeoxyribonuclease V alpha subunit
VPGWRLFSEPSRRQSGFYLTWKLNSTEVRRDMAAKLIEICGQFLRERYRSESLIGDGSDFVICEVYVNGDVSATCSFLGEADRTGIWSLIPQVNYRFYGNWTDDYTNKRTGQREKQFKFKSFVLAEQADRGAVIRYLEAAGQGLGFGHSKASLLWDRFHAAAIKVLRETPEVAHAALVAAGKSHSTYSFEKLQLVSQILHRDAHIEEALVGLNALLHKRGFPRKLPKRLIQELGVEATRIIGRDPFTMLARRLPGCGFTRCNNMYDDLGLPPGRLKRQMFAAWQRLAKDTEGHTWIPYETAKLAIRQVIGVLPAEHGKLQPERAIELGIRGGWLSTIHTEGSSGPISTSGKMAWLAERGNADDELLVAAKLVELGRQPSRWPDVAKLNPKVSDHQRTELAKALAEPVGAFIGGPGTGKSFTTAAVIDLAVRTFGEYSVAAAAPTNKAAVRLTQALEGYGVGLRAMSFHRMLGVKSIAGGRWEFRHNETNPLPYKVLFLDESSMDSINLAAALLRACQPGTHILWIGDAWQLPPIDNGAVLRDMLAAQIPTGVLTEPQRNAGDIVFACDDIRQGKRFRQSEKIDLDVTPPRNFKFLELLSPEAQAEGLLKYLETLQRNGFDPIWDCQVMVAVNDKSAVSRIALNNLLQREFNSAGRGPSGCRFKSGDKVVCESGGMYKLADPTRSNSGDDSDSDGSSGGSEYVAKGEFGKVIDSQIGFVVVRFDGRQDSVKVPVFGNAKATADEIEEAAASEAERDKDSKPDPSESSERNAISLAYAATVHKMQGSECKVGIPIIDEYPGAKRLGTREWFLTAISRGKVLTRPIGKVSTAQEFCRKSSLARRKTLLKERILLLKAKELLESL